MDELEISGKRYISTRRAGREHKYHSDYIGQLIRGGKVQGQKVGRSWYVDEDSLVTYLGKEPVKKEMLVEAVAETPSAAVETPVKEEIEAPVEKPSRVTPWKKIPEVAAVEPVVKSEIEVGSEEKEVVVEEPIPAVEVEEEVKEEESVNHISIRKTPKEEKKKNITYVAENAPVFPVKMRKQKISASISDTTPEEERVEEKEETDVVAARGQKAIRPLQYGVVAMLGVLAFIVVGGMSYLLSYEATVEGDQMSASITLSK